MKRSVQKLCVGILVFAAACSPQDDVDKKKEKLKELKAEAQEIKLKINALEEEIIGEDSVFASEQDKSTLVSTLPLEKKTFVHHIEVRGSVESKKNIRISAETSGAVLGINVQEGDYVKKGTVLLRIEAETMRNNIAELRTSLELATTIYEKQANLWAQKIGTEVQYLQAKNNKESLERSLTTVQSQLAKAVVRAPFSGFVDQLDVRVGEMVMPGTPLLGIVSMDEMYVTADIAENYIGKIEQGDSITISFPTLGKEVRTRVSSLGRVINPQNRTFSLETRLPKNTDYLKPNQVAILKLKDYEKENAIVVPTNLVQSDSKGDFVYLYKTTNGKATAEKVMIERGVTYENETEVLSGLTGNEVIIDKGFRDVSDGVLVKESTSSAISRR